MTTATAALQALVPSVEEHGHEFRGDWLVLWAIAGRPLHADDDREAIMQAEGFDPSGYALQPTRVVNKMPEGRYRSWWYASVFERKA